MLLNLFDTSSYRGVSSARLLISDLTSSACGLMIVPAYVASPSMTASIIILSKYYVPDEGAAIIHESIEVMMATPPQI